MTDTIEYRLGELSAGIEYLKDSYETAADERAEMKKSLDSIQNLLAPIPARLTAVEKTTDEYKSIRNRAAGAVTIIIFLWAVIGDHIKQAIAKVIF